MGQLVQRTILRCCAIVFFATAAGCATVGPGVTSAELKGVRNWLEAKAVRFKHGQLLRVNRIGYQLVEHVSDDISPSEEGKGRPVVKQYPFIGWLLAHMDQAVAKAYGMSKPGGVIIAGVIPNSPAEQAGLQAGDVLRSLNGETVPFKHKVARIIKDIEPGNTLEVQFERHGQQNSVVLIAAAVPKNIVFHMTEEENINAYAEPGGVITVTYGMMRFMRSDDELAVVLGHEIAHLAKRHISKGLGTGIFAGLIGGTLGGVVEIFAPGLGSPIANTVSGAIQAQFSKDFEREADYVGLQYVYKAGLDVQAGQKVWERFAVELPQTMVGHFLSTHPPSPERMVRIQKAAYALLNRIPLEQIETADIPLQLDPFLEKELSAEQPDEVITSRPLP